MLASGNSLEIISANLSDPVDLSHRANTAEPEPDMAAYDALIESSESNLSFMYDISGKTGKTLASKSFFIRGKMFFVSLPETISLKGCSGMPGLTAE